METALTNRALFLDRDGVINTDHGYVVTPDRCDFIDGIFDLCHHAVNAGYKIIIITNQAGIGRGYYSEDEFHEFMSWMKERFTDAAVKITEVYYCPYHPEHGIGAYKRASNCRKPNPGMILEAQKDFQIDLESSVLIGDKIKDIEAGRAAGIGTNLLFDNRKGVWKEIKVIYRLEAAKPFLSTA